MLSSEETAGKPTVKKTCFSLKRMFTEKDACPLCDAIYIFVKAK